MNLLLYGLVVAIWGTTWIALKWQLGSVPIALSIGYRFALAAFVLFALLAREPVFLFPELAKRQHEWAGNFDASGTAYRLLVRHGGGRAHE